MSDDAPVSYAPYATPEPRRRCLNKAPKTPPAPRKRSRAPKPTTPTEPTTPTVLALDPLVEALLRCKREAEQRHLHDAVAACIDQALDTLRETLP